MNDPLGLFEEDSNKDPLGLFSEDKPVADKEPSMFDFLTGSARKGFTQAPVASALQTGSQGSIAALETGAQVGTGGVAQVAGLVPAALQSMNKMGQGQAPGFEKNYAGAMDAMTYQPRTEMGEQASGAVGEFMNKNVIPVAPMLLPNLGRGMRAVADRKAAIGSLENSVPKRKGADTAGILSELENGKAEPQARQPIDPADPLWQKAVQSGDEALIQRLKTIDRQETLKDNTMRGEETMYVDPQGQAFKGNPAEPIAKEALERQTGAMETAMETGKFGETKDSPLPQLSKDLEQVKAELEQVSKDAKMADIQKQLEARKRDLEIDVERQTKLDMNAAARQRMGFSRKQGGAINPEVFAEGFEKLKQLADGTWLRAYNRDGMLMVEAVKDSRKMGEVAFNPMEKNNALGFERERPRSELRSHAEQTDLKAGIAHVNPENRGKGYATDMYKFASELGNDIRASSIQTPQGTKMWNSFEKKGLANSNGYIPKKQRGVLMIDPNHANKAQVLNTVGGIRKVLGEIAPRLEKAEDVITAAKTMKDVEQNLAQKMLNAFTKGGLYQAIKTGNPVVKFASDKILNADRLSRAEIQEFVHGKLGPAFRELNKKEQAELWSAMSYADLVQKEITPDMLAKYGFNEKQVAALEAHREVMKHAFTQLNKAREILGKKPVEERVAYAAMRSSGDFRRLVYSLDEQGNKVVVGIVGSNFRKKVNGLKESLEAKGFKVGEERYYGGSRQRNSVNEAFMDAVEFLADQDPRAKAFLEVLDNISKDEAYNFLNTKRHTMQKKGIEGMEGRKSWLTAEENAKDGLHAQMQYAEAAIKWGHIAEAAVEIRKVINEPSLKMPNAVKWTEEYLQNAMGFNPSEFGRKAEDTVAALFNAAGVGYSIPRQTMAVSRKVVNTVLLGLNPAFWTTNLVQPLASMPAMKAYLTSRGLDASFDFGTGGNYLAKGGITAAKKTMGKMDAFEQAATDYAKKHHVYGSDLVEHSNLPRKTAEYYADKVGNFAAGAIESSTRQMMFYGLSHLLKENGMSVKNGLFEAAHNLTDMAMNNYSPTERPQFYNKLGPVGDLAANLQSYKHNELSRIAMFAREAATGNVRPLLTQLATGVFMAGVLGTIGFAEADQLYKYITKLAGKPDSLTGAVIRLSESMPVAGNKNAMSHGAFSFMGLDMSKRLGMQDVVPNSLAEAAFPGGAKLGKIAGEAYDFAKSPTEMNGKRLAREAAPGFATGAMDRQWFSKQTPQGELAVSPTSMQGTAYRNDADKMAKNFGFTGVNESVQKNKMYEVNYVKQQFAELRTKPLQKAKDELFTNNKVSRETVQEYLKYEGDLRSLEADIARMAKEQNMSTEQREWLRVSMGDSVAKAMQAKRMLEMFKK